MLERVVASLLHRYLGKYIQDLDTENLNLGIFGGDVQLTDLKVKPDALYELDLPIEVKVGTIGRLSIKIPWGCFSREFVSIEVEDVYIIVTPITDREYDPEKEKRLMRASKRRKLELLEAGHFLGSDAPESSSFVENLMTTIMSNLQVLIRNVHIRYEDSATRADCLLAAGLCLQSLSIETTNSKWKPRSSGGGGGSSSGGSVYQMVKVDCLSVYCNPGTRELIGTGGGEPGAAPYTWRADMRRGLETFSVRGEEFEFIVKPIAAKMKLIVNKSNEARVPKLLVDLVLQDAATQLSRQQYLALIELIESFKRIEINRKYRQLRPKTAPGRGSAAAWWRYFYTGLLEQRLRPYTWPRIATHRKNYRRYRDIYKQSLLKPTDTELKLDLQQAEDLLTITDIVIAREDAKIQLLREEGERVRVVERRSWEGGAGRGGGGGGGGWLWDWWRRTGGESSSRRRKSQLDTPPGAGGGAGTPVEVALSPTAGGGTTGRGLWAQLSPGERALLCQAIGYSPESEAVHSAGGQQPEKPKQYIEHKVNFTLANCSLSLLNRGHEMLVLTLAQFLASLETRPSAGAFKLSARIESIVIEGASIEHDLLPIITADNNYTGNSGSNFLSIDFEKNPLNSEADYGLTVNLESVEIVYHEHAISELMSFVQTGSGCSLEGLSAALSRAAFSGVQTLCTSAIRRSNPIDLSIHLGLPYLVIPELGTLQKGGNLLIIDLGHVTLTSELQPNELGLEDATQMEIEEKLYDRFHIEFSEFQVLFCDSGDLWRDAKKMPDSEYHLLPKLQLSMAFSNSIRPEYRLLPRHKMNASLLSLKLNISDRKIGSVMDFLDNLPLPSPNTVHVSISSNTVCLRSVPELRKDEYRGDPTTRELSLLKVRLVSAELRKQNKLTLLPPPPVSLDRTAAKLSLLSVDKVWISSDQSEEEHSEVWARSVDLPGFDDNVSPNNGITVLLRFICGEIVVGLCRSCNRVDKPYLMLRLTKVCCDAALMQYGPALQASLGSLQLVDKLHTGSSGEYLELIATTNSGTGGDLASLLYRKVRSDCPDFKSHFHNVEQSLVLDFNSAAVVLHREAAVTLSKYLQYLLQKLQSREVVLLERLTRGWSLSPLLEKITQTDCPDPPIPPGATKFSYSTRLQEFKIKLCDTDLDFLEIKLRGVESDCLFKANERMVFHCYLASLAVDHLSEMTLYPKILWLEDEKVLDLKYVRHSPRLYKQYQMATSDGVKPDDVKSDGSLKLYLGRLHFVFICKILLDLQLFLEPFIKPNLIPIVVSYIDKYTQEKFALLRSCTTRLHLAVTLHTPSLLFPQRGTSPNLLIFSLGDLSVENFFKEKTAPIEDAPVSVIDNILIRLENVQICRAVMTLAGTLEIQEPILEPVSVKVDMKRTVDYHSVVRALSGIYLQPSAQPHLFQLTGNTELLRWNLGQRDLAVLLAVWAENFSSGAFIEEVRGRWYECPETSGGSPGGGGLAASEEQAVRKLQAFFYPNEAAKRESSLSFSLDCLQIYLFSDSDEILSSPVRDMNQGLCKLETGEATLTVDVFSDKSIEMKMSLQTCFIDDIRKETDSTQKRMLECVTTAGIDESTQICVSSPPLVDLVFRATPGGDRDLDLTLEALRLCLTVSSLLDLSHFLLDSLPPLQEAAGQEPAAAGTTAAGEPGAPAAALCPGGGLINLGYVGDTSLPPMKGGGASEVVRPPSSADSTSGYLSSRASQLDEQTGMCVSAQIRRPEILLYARSGLGLGLSSEVLLDTSHQPGHRQSSSVLSFSGLILYSARRGHDSSRDTVLQPCDIEFAKSQKMNEESLKVTLNVSPVDIHITPNTVHAVRAIIDEVRASLSPEEGDKTNLLFNSMDTDDLWSPKKISPYTFPQKYNSDYERVERLKECLTVSVPSVRTLLELEEAGRRVPLVFIKLSSQTSVQNSSKYLQVKGEMQIQASYYNCKVGAWEPLLEPCVEEEGVYRPHEILFKLFRGKAYPIQPCLSQERESGGQAGGGGKPAGGGGQPAGGGGGGRVPASHSHLHHHQSQPSEESQTSADEAAEPDTSSSRMVFIRRRQVRSDRKSKHESVSLISYPDDSDSDNEEGVMEKLANAISHVFTGGSSDEGEDSESGQEDSSGAEPSADTEDNSELESVTASLMSQLPVSGKESRAIFLKKHSDSVDSGLETEGVHKMTNYFLVESSDRLELNLTSEGLSVLDSLGAAFSAAPPPLLPAGCRSSLHHTLQESGGGLSLANHISPGSLLTLLSKAESGAPKVLLSARYERSDSVASSAASSPAGTDFFSPAGSEGDPDYPEDGFQSRKGTTGGGGDETERSGLLESSPELRFPSESLTVLTSRITDLRLRVHIPGFDEMEVLCPQRSVHKLHLLQPSKNNTRYYLVLSVECSPWGRRVLVRSPLQVKNETCYALALFYKKAVLERLGFPLLGESTNPFGEMHRLAVVEPDEVFNVPLSIAHHAPLFLQPAYLDLYGSSESGLWWQDLATDLNTPKDILCSPKDQSEPTVFSVRTLTEEGEPTASRTSRLIPKYLIRLLPPLAFHNRLPYAIEIKVPSIKFEIRIEAGEKASMYFLSLLKAHKININVPSYLGLSWTGGFTLSRELEERVIPMSPEQETEGGNKQMGLSLCVERAQGSALLVFHAAYWIINRTRLPLQIRGSLSEVVYEAETEEPLLFSFRKPRRQSVRLRVYQSSWSSAFCLDAFATSGLIICKDVERKRHYRILLKTELSQVCPHLTKLVTLLPNFMVTNLSKRALRFMEENEKNDLWIDLAPAQTLPFWPETEKMNMFVKFRDSKVISQHFPITTNHETVLRMDKGSALVVAVTGGGEQPFLVSFRAYLPGDAPVRVENLCEDLFLKIHQQHLGQVALLSPYQCLLYTWDDPCRERTLLWNVYNKKSKDFTAEICRDGYGQERLSFTMVRGGGSTVSPAGTAGGTGSGAVSAVGGSQSSGAGGAGAKTDSVTSKLSASFKRLSTPLQSGQSSSSEDSESDELQKTQLTKKTRKDKVIVYWVSYREGPQRVLLFTQDERVAYSVRLKIDSEKSHLEFFLSLKGIGLSLMSEPTGEVCYSSVSDSAPAWEVCVAHKWKALSLDLAAWLEDRYRHDVKRAQMKEFLHVDFDKMEMTKPFYGELRRRYMPGLWLQLRLSPSYLYLDCKVHKFQIENQMSNAIFPIVLYPKPLPSAIVRKVEVKPCAEVVLLKRNDSPQNQLVIKDLKVVLQEFSVQVEKSFLLTLYEFFSPWIAESKPSVRIRRDIGLLHQPLTNWCVLSKEPRILVESIHLSGLSLELSFLLKGPPMGSSAWDRHYLGDLLHFLLDTLTPAHPEVKGVIIRTGSFERKGLSVNPTNLVTEVWSHYRSQLVPQLHVLILGQDILGSPYSAVPPLQDLSQSYQPALSGEMAKDELSEGLSEGAHMLLGHICTGGSCNTGSLITAALSPVDTSAGLQEDLRKRRRHCLEASSELPSALLRYRRTFEVGIALGMSGLIIKHPSGVTSEDGLEAFFRGVGKGLLGLLTKPGAAGVLDPLSMASHGIKRASETCEEFVLRTRQPRYLNPYLGLKPASTWTGGGVVLLSRLNKGQYAGRDLYWAHAPLSPQGRTFLLVSLQHVFLVEKCRLWGTWEAEWAVRVDDIMAVPTVSQTTPPYRLVLKVRLDDSCHYLPGTEEEDGQRWVESDELELLLWLREKIEAVLVLNMEDRPCSIAAAVHT